MRKVPFGLDYWYNKKKNNYQLSMVSARLCVLVNSTSMALCFFS